MSKALELSRRIPKSLRFLGCFMRVTNQLDRATQFLEKAITLRPSYSDALNNLGVLYVRQNKFSPLRRKI